MTNSEQVQSSGFKWFKSSYSEGSGNACVEVAFDSHTVRVRDSKDTHVPGLSVSESAWSSFMTGVIG